MTWSFLIVLVALCSFIYEFPRLRKKKQVKELWLYILSICASVVLNVAVSLQAHIPNPLDFISYLFRPMGKMISTLLT
ncbi:hypothetical protein A8709_07535 [Paenibacillus pectinilyticus]|uniref:Uncharacterized protein n=1 Tax=Paenibacillus pectinilyticus TaxID=512399 RepID=A0A1C0ZTV6_9BACL|nr:hypothetical protein [Paenibacillus pectinilyticus]OCT11508.1 hypothetical protein A8709_07535 [Paenibacillus pectinilyticus]